MVLEGGFQICILINISSTSRNSVTGRSNELNPGSHAKEARARALAARELVSGIEDTVRDGTFKGQWKDGVPHGLGILHHEDTRRYEGEFREGEVDGYCVEYHEDGSRYEGQWYCGNPSGQGISFRADGGVYEGEWKDGRYHGRGSDTEANGQSYKGEYQFGEPHGRGIFRFSDGTWREGDWVNGSIVRGKALLIGGMQYDGEWKCVDDDPTRGKLDVPHGKGIMKLPSGEIYDGDFENGEKHGQGSWTDGYKMTYDGQWENGKPDGFGIQELLDESGEPEIRYEGMWSNGARHGIGKLVEIQTGLSTWYEFRNGIAIRELHDE